MIFPATKVMPLCFLGDTGYCPVFRLLGSKFQIQLAAVPIGGAGAWTLRSMAIWKLGWVGTFMLILISNYTCEHLKLSWIWSLRTCMIMMMIMMMMMVMMMRRRRRTSMILFLWDMCEMMRRCLPGSFGEVPSWKGAYHPRWFMSGSHCDPSEAVQIVKDRTSKGCDMMLPPGGAGSKTAPHQGVWISTILSWFPNRSDNVFRRYQIGTPWGQDFRGNFGMRASSQDLNAASALAIHWGSMAGSQGRPMPSDAIWDEWTAQPSEVRNGWRCTLGEA